MIHVGHVSNPSSGIYQALYVGEEPAKTDADLLSQCQLAERTRIDVAPGMRQAIAVRRFRLICTERDSF